MNSFASFLDVDLSLDVALPACALLVALAVYLWRRQPEPRPPALKIQPVGTPRSTKPTGISTGASGKQVHRQSMQGKTLTRVQEEDASRVPLKIFFGSQTGTAEEFARKLASEGKHHGFATQVVDLEDYEPVRTPSFTVGESSLTVK